MNAANIMNKDYLLRANYQSWSAGIKFIFGGHSNEVLSRLTFNYLGGGQLNYLITMSDFIYFIRDL